jgi:transcriptional regulator with XRE-family HTH domain
MKANEVIKLKRKEKDMTLRELAEKVGVSEATVSRWESGDIRSMKRKNIEALSKILGISPAILMEWEEYEETGNEPYYLDPETREMAEFLKNNKDYKVLFDAIRTVRPSDIDSVKEFIEQQNGNT